MEFHSCEPCNKYFNGIRPYRDHLASPKHKKKVGQEQPAPLVMDSPISTLRSYHPYPDPSIITQGKDYWCSLCKLPLNGPEQALSHVKGSKHLKLKLYQPVNSKNDIATEIPKIDLSNIKLSYNPKDIYDSYSDFKFSFHGVTIEKVLEKVKVFGANDPIEF